jgi:hypothetical protein
MHRLQLPPFEIRIIFVQIELEALELEAFILHTKANVQQHFYVGMKIWY